MLFNSMQDKIQPCCALCFRWSEVECVNFDLCGCICDISSALWLTSLSLQLREMAENYENFVKCGNMTIKIIFF